MHPRRNMPPAGGIGRPARVRDEWAFGPVVLYLPPTDTPEKALLRALLERAVQDVHEKDPTARAWIFSNSEHVFGYVYVCRHLGLEPAEFRKHISAFEKRKRPSARGHVLRPRPRH